MADNEIDELFELKSALYLGNNQQCINEAQHIKASLSPELKIMRDCYMYRAYIAQRKYGIVLDEINLTSSADQLQAVRLLADYLSNEGNRASIVRDLDAKANSGSFDASQTVFILMAASIYYHEGNFNSALKVLHASDDIECLALTLQCLLQLDRIDLAKKTLKRMLELDEDSISTQMGQAFFNLHIGGDKLQDAYYIFQEQADKHSSTPLLLNGQASCFLAQQKYKEAEEMLQEALERENSNPETLVNLILVSQLGKAPEVSNRYLSTLKDSCRSHPFVRDYLSKEEEFDRLSKNYTVAT